MPEGQGPSITRRRLREELKSLRESAGLSQSKVVAELDWSLSKLTRIENGTVGVSVTDVRALLGVFKTPTEVADELVVLARAAREKRWWNAYRDVVSQQLQEFIGFEADATRMRQFHPTTVPGLLQIEPYIHAVGPGLMLKPMSAERYESLVEVRLKRQAEVLYGDNRPEFTAIVDEGALHRHVGGVANMRAQLLHLADIEANGVASIGIVPFSAGAHFGMTGAFHIFDFADNADASVLYTADKQDGVELQSDLERIAQYGKQFDDLFEISVKGAEAVKFLHKISEEMG